MSEHDDETTHKKMNGNIGSNFKIPKPKNYNVYMRNENKQLDSQ
jgi:hypothetical protein